MSSTAVLIDGAFFLARFRKVYTDRDANDPRVAAKTAFTMAIEHIRALDRPKEALFRIFFYDCEPLDKVFQRPVSGDNIDFGESNMAHFRWDLHDNLRRQRKMALRLGRLSDRGGEWQLKRATVQALRDGSLQWADLRDDHYELDMRQTQVDVKIGIDIASIAFKRQVDQIVLVAGDSDFIPAAKLARREGIDFILDPMWQGIAAELNEHVDGLQSVCPRPY